MVTHRCSVRPDKESVSFLNANIRQVCLAKASCKGLRPSVSRHDTAHMTALMMIAKYNGGMGLGVLDIISGLRTEGHPLLFCSNFASMCMCRALWAIFLGRPWPS